MSRMWRGCNEALMNLFGCCGKVVSRLKQRSESFGKGSLLRCFE